jgi:glycosyltransferase involved in cell wall biosynthesis
MKISIITVTYNSEATISDTLESVLKQTYLNYEYIIVDGLSRDKTIEIIKEYEPQFDGRMRWISESDKGIYDAMNKGFQMANGDVLMLINSDDLFIDKDSLKYIATAFVENPGVDAVYADLCYVAPNNTNKIIRRWKTKEQKPFAKGWLPAHPTFYVKREIYQKYGYFDLEYKLAADFELMLRFVEKYKIELLYLPKYLVKMRYGGATSGSLKNIYLQNVECVRAFKKNGVKSSPLYIVYRFIPKIKQFFRKS